ncbi:MAG: hypothetical protein JJV97_04360 [SAR324 cluster bacterium]|nr:hypothetical protein [SAR324 cluster bacterium]
MIEILVWGSLVIIAIIALCWYVLYPILHGNLKDISNAEAPHIALLESRLNQLSSDFLRETITEKEYQQRVLGIKKELNIIKK